MWFASLTLIFLCCYEQHGQSRIMMSWKSLTHSIKSWWDFTLNHCVPQRMTPKGITEINYGKKLCDGISWEPLNDVQHHRNQSALGFSHWRDADGASLKELFEYRKKETCSELSFITVRQIRLKISVVCQRKYSHCADGQKHCSNSSSGSG